MRTQQNFIDGTWRASTAGVPFEVVNPANEDHCATVMLGTVEDVDDAVRSARRAFRDFSVSTVADRLALLHAIKAEYSTRVNDLAAAMTMEMGAPKTFALGPQVGTGLAHITRMISVLDAYPFEWMQGETKIVREPIGVAGLITPWNWPSNQIACKVIPALAAGCTMVHKPSELAPLSAVIWAEILEVAGVPAGVYNLVQGDGATVGHAISSHPGIDLVHFTGSTRAGIAVAQSAATTVKKVALELGGKSANIVLPDADLAVAVTGCVKKIMGNSGQSCAAPARLLVQRDQCAEAARIAADVAEALIVGDPMDPATDVGPLANEAQYRKVKHLIQQGVIEGAQLVCGGAEHPNNLERGFFVRPTIFTEVSRDMQIARDEIFGPVLVIMPYTDEEDAIEIANSSEYGLAAYVQSGDTDRARKVASRLQAGRIEINLPAWDDAAPFGGYKRSGIGREYGKWGLEEFLEIKALIGCHV
ncbi:MULTISPECIES: aldehyde dehydrogenase family protein [unclassified Mesorhizobium]|uniref:aldehyde dehydrogenase family protein n=1 Tax=unclassified Mesorhizobium TaxID=325217 RepID=UPI000F75E07A|nr:MULTISPECIES: aldehyde dehydrogenase family protein [unclassified Mesorhizobium]AZO32261.1 aldehyde dehydrogenase family protein [Mesorhizobium sp. M1B.F.Ca.ET.045.04.1.1]TIV62139.1 MAG: aldehyde dehydrogenase family protein [Mesorhizobium sp.]